MADKDEPLDDFRKIPAESNLKKVHTEALKRWSAIVSREEESRILSVIDLVFIDQEGGMYNETNGFLSGNADKNRTSSSDTPEPPRYQIDRISPVIEQAVSDQRESQIQIQVSSTGEIPTGLDETFDGLIKNIESVSDAGDAYDNAYDECQKSGYGGIQIVTEFSDETFEQEIFIEPILNATQSLFFGPAKKATKEDALYAFLIWELDMEEFEAAYPKAQKSEWPDSTLDKTNRAWFNNKDHLIRIAAYWRKRPITKEIIMLTDERVINDEDLAAAIASGAEIQKRPDGEEMRRTVDTYQVERFIMNGVEVLKGPQEWVGKFIPLIPEYGIRSVINGREIIRGKVRKGKDPAMIYDYTVSSIVQASAASGKDFHWLTAKQAEGYVNDLDAIDNDTNFAYYNHDPDSPGPPVKAAGPTIQQALIDQRNAAKEDINMTVGAGVGIGDGTSADPRSGEAIREGNVNTEKGNSIYFNNHIRMVRHGGVQIADLIAKLWTTRQQKRIIKPDGTKEFITVNQQMTQAKEGGGSEIVIINDLTQAKFDVTVDVGPAYASQRQQGADQLTKLATENPAIADVTIDLAVKNMDIPGGDEMHRRLRRRGILNGTIEPTDEEREEMGLTERDQLIAELEPQIREKVMQEENIKLVTATANMNNASAANFQASAGQKVIENDKTGAEEEKLMAETANIDAKTITEAVTGMKELIESFIAKLEAGIPLDLQDHDNRTKQADVVEEAQHVQSPGPSSALQEEVQGGAGNEIEMEDAQGNRAIVNADTREIVREL